MALRYGEGRNGEGLPEVPQLVAGLQVEQRRRIVCRLRQRGGQPRLRPLRGAWGGTQPLRAFQQAIRPAQAHHLSGT